MFYFRNLHDSKVTAVHFTQANKAHHTTQDVLPALIVEQHQKKKKKPQQHNTTTDNTNNALLH